MVNNANISSYLGSPPNDEFGERLIRNGPIYKGAEIIEILSMKGRMLYPGTRDCARDITSLGLEIKDVGQLIIAAINKGKFLKSAWCKCGNDSWAACDSYWVEWKYFNEYAGKLLSVEYYLKFAIGITGKVIIVVSCHYSS